jgi:hypothetical protein
LIQTVLQPLALVLRLLRAWSNSTIICLSKAGSSGKGGAVFGWAAEAEVQTGTSVLMLQ